MKPLFLLPLAAAFAFQAHAATYYYSGSVGAISVNNADTIYLGYDQSANPVGGTTAVSFGIGNTPLSVYVDGTADISLSYGDCPANVRYTLTSGSTLKWNVNNVDIGWGRPGAAFTIDMGTFTTTSASSFEVSGGMKNWYKGPIALAGAVSLTSGESLDVILASSGTSAWYSSQPVLGSNGYFDVSGFTFSDGSGLEYTLNSSATSLDDLAEGEYAFIGEKVAPGDWGFQSVRMIVKGHTYVIPESSTATLGLLALAGLAARRRRRR